MMKISYINRNVVIKYVKITKSKKKKKKKKRKELIIRKTQKIIITLKKGLCQFFIKSHKAYSNYSRVLISLFSFHIDPFHQASIMVSIPSEKFLNNNWLKIPLNQCFQVQHHNRRLICCWSHTIR